MPRTKKWWKQRHKRRKREISFLIFRHKIFKENLTFSSNFKKCSICSTLKFWIALEIMEWILSTTVMCLPICMFQMVVNSSSEILELAKSTIFCSFSEYWAWCKLPKEWGFVIFLPSRTVFRKSPYLNLLTAGTARKWR